MADDLRKIFATNLRRYMSEQGKTQADMARHFGISTATASDWYNDNKIPRADKLQSIADWLNIDLADLLTDPEKRKQEYYLDPDTARKAQQIFDDPNLCALFDASKDSRPEDLQMAADLLRRLKETNRDG